MILRLGLALLALLTGLAGWQAWQRHQTERALAEARSQLDTARQEAGRLQAELEFARLSARVVTRYIDRAMPEDDPKNPKILLTEPGIGYRFIADE